MDSSSPPPSSSLQLAMAALVGASLMAISAFFIHKRSVDQVLDRLITIRRNSLLKEKEKETVAVDDKNHDEDEEHGSDGELILIDRKILVSHSLDDDTAIPSYRRMSSSMPNVVLINDWFDEESMRFGLGSHREDNNLNFIPLGLPPLHTVPRQGDDKTLNYSSSLKRLASMGRLMTPRSPSGNAFDYSGDSEDEGTALADEDTTIYSQNVDSSADYINDIDPKIQNSTALQFSYVDSTNSVPGQNFEQHGDRKGHATSGHQVGSNPVIATMILPQRTSVPESINIEEEEVRKMIRECLDLRNSYLYTEKVAPWMKHSVEESTASEVNTDHFEPFPATSHCFRMEDGVVHVYASEHDTVELFPVASATAFFTDMHHVLRIMSIGNVRSACYLRLRFLEEKFRLHLLINADRESMAQKGAPHRDFYNIRKVDTHVHHSACMNQKHLLRFIKSKLREEPDEVVIFRDGKYMTLNEVFESLDLTVYDLNVDLLDVHADKSTFHRFDKFNLKYNPCGQSRLREIFLKQDNLIQGRFLAEVTKRVLSDLEASKYQMAEYRVSIYGRKQSEWDQLASWFINNAIYSENAVWLIQVVGLDIVDDESRPERRPTKHMPKPAEWTNEFNPAYSYYAYYCYANLYTLNKLRESKGLPTIKFRPHCGEAGDVDHLAAAFLLCNNISHGINLRKSPVLQYLYYLAQIGLAMSPLSNNSLFLNYHHNPFPIFFQRGLNVSLSTDDPLQIHLTKEPLVEEYSVAAKVWKLSACDLCEIARNSVYQSGFSHAAKLHWLGSKYFLRGPEGNNIHKSNVPDIRIVFRHETWKEEMQYVFLGIDKFPEELDF
ncbi:AMP deaminase isoform X3 [Populus trichocarpa]|uniref:AMP deaminase isoform X3 n=1 Tax=Populus trichocarpa TaxID=3694 RepID=UPI000D188F3C|nr:AMP deaminase isoform X3 [Populus trichocarpa]|eukprot:XP_024466816.1 AMP deaminase isoform X3 [Populus trichocarpa]